MGGIRELAAAALIASGAALLELAARLRFAPGSLLPLALVCAALIAVLSAGVVMWMTAATRPARDRR